jgi:multimeric flavodoxin WrbA
MKVIAINGSPRNKGNTAYLLEVMSNVLTKEGFEVETKKIGSEKIFGCLACGYCRSSEKNLCIQKDILNDISLEIREADGFILGAPTYYGGIPGTMKAFLDRLFYSSSTYFKYKVATTVSVVRRTGGLDVQHQLMNFLNLAHVLVPPSQYWRVVYGRDKGESADDGEGVQTVKANAEDMAWLLKVVEFSRDKIPFPEKENRVFTNFIRR